MEENFKISDLNDLNNKDTTIRGYLDIILVLEELEEQGPKIIYEENIDWDKKTKEEQELLENSTKNYIILYEEYSLRISNVNLEKQNEEEFEKTDSYVQELHDKMNKKWIGVRAYYETIRQIHLDVLGDYLKKEIEFNKTILSEIQLNNKEFDKKMKIYDKETKKFKKEIFSGVGLLLSVISILQFNLSFLSKFSEMHSGYRLFVFAGILNIIILIVIFVIMNLIANIFNDESINNESDKDKKNKSVEFRYLKLFIVPILILIIISSWCMWQDNEQMKKYSNEKEIIKKETQEYINEKVDKIKIELENEYLKKQENNKNKFR